MRKAVSFVTCLLIETAWKYNSIIKKKAAQNWTAF